jgi:ribosomal-protein-serine acetyltransferase
VSVADRAHIERLPERIEGEGLVLRRWLASDALRLHKAVAESAEHLRPWMGWMVEEPQPVDQRREMLLRWEQEWSAGGDARYAIDVGGAVAGSCGLHRRLGPDVLEIGYWIHASLVRRGVATKVAALLTDAAFTVSGIRRVEIHHDKANVASAGVPRRLGYEFVGEQADEAAAPADTGVECVWRMGRSQWESR